MKYRKGTSSRLIFRGNEPSKDAPVYQAEPRREAAGKEREYDPRRCYFGPPLNTLESSFSAVSTPIFATKMLPNTHFAAFFEIYKIDIPLHRSKFNIY